MSDRDKEFLDALRKFGGDDDGMSMLSGLEDDDSFGDDDMDDDASGDASGGDDDAAFFEALEQYGGPQMAGGGGMAAGAQDMTAVPAVAALCRTWRSVRPIVSRILSIVRRVPGIGGALVNAVNTLTRLLDAICRGTNPRTLCRQWRGGLRAIMVRIASIVGAIPFIGGRMRRAVRSLIAAIDAVCRAIS